MGEAPTTDAAGVARRPRSDAVLARGQSGVSLVEVLVVVGVLVPVILAAALGLLTSAKLSTSTKISQQLNAAAASYAESLKEIAYVDCAVAADYSGDSELWSPPSGSGISVTITGVEYWDQSSQDYYLGSCSSDAGSQRLAIHLTDADGETDLSVVKRNPAGYPIPPGP